MFGKIKPNKKLPAINLMYKEGQGLFGPKKVKTTRREQRAMKKELIKQYPDRYFIDKLGDYNSIDPDFNYLDEYSIYDIFLED